MQAFVLRSLDLRFRRAASLSLGRLPGHVGGTAAFRDLEAEGVADGYLLPDKRGDELLALLYGRIKVCRVGMEPHIIVNNAPMLVGVMLLAVVVDAGLVYRTSLGRPACLHGCRYKY